VSQLVIRRCTYVDLPALEWDGELAGERDLFARVFALAQNGSMVMLVANHLGIHLGQVWIDLARHPAGASLWALRVKPHWRSRGVGTALVVAGERIATAVGKLWTEIDVELDNPRARTLYERLGYRWVRRGPALDSRTGEPLAYDLDTLRRPLSVAR